MCFVQCLSRLSLLREKLSNFLSYSLLSDLLIRCFTYEAPEIFYSLLISLLPSFFLQIIDRARLQILIISSSYFGFSKFYSFLLYIILNFFAGIENPHSYPQHILAIHSSKRLLVEQISPPAFVLADTLINLTLAKGQRHEVRVKSRNLFVLCRFLFINY